MDQDIKNNIPKHLENDPLAPYNASEADIEREVDEFLSEENEDIFADDLELLEEEF